MSEPEFSLDKGLQRMLSSTGIPKYANAADKTIYGAVDNPPVQPNHRAMTDLTRQEVDAKLAQNKAEVDARLANFDTSIKTGFAELRVEMVKMRGDFEKHSHDSTKWIIGAVAGMLSLSVAVLAAIINFSKSDKPPAPQLAPIVVYAQPAPQAPAPAQPPAK